MARGDHVEVDRPGYRHHGIDIGDGTLVHFTGEPMRKSQATVERANWDEFLRGSHYKIVSYNQPILLPDHTCLRALNLVGMTGYQLVQRNCEHFATYCKTGTARSLQVEESASRIVKYSRFAIKQPAMILAGPAFELGKRLAQAAAFTAQKGTPGPVQSHLGGPASFRSLFRYVDLYRRSGSPDSYLVASLYGQWLDLASGRLLPSRDSSAVLYGNVIVDDALTQYICRPTGVYRFGPEDNDLKHIGGLYGSPGREATYLVDESGACTPFLPRESGKTTSLPAGSNLVGFLFRDASEIDHVMSRQGWQVRRKDKWAPENAPRCDLRYIS